MVHATQSIHKPWLGNFINAACYSFLWIFEKKKPGTVYRNKNSLWSFHLCIICIGDGGSRLCERQWSRESKCMVADGHIRGDYDRGIAAQPDGLIIGF